MEQVNKRSEYRTCKIETRVDEKQEGGKKLVLRGYPILFNTEAEIYDFWYGKKQRQDLCQILGGYPFFRCGRRRRGQGESYGDCGVSA